MSRIKEVTSNSSSVKIKLENGVELDVHSNNGYFNLSFSFIEVPMKMGHCLPGPEVGTATMSNIVNIYYNKTHQDAEGM